MARSGWIACLVLAAGCLGGGTRGTLAPGRGPEAAIEAALRGIHADLKRIRADFPQLAAIDKGSIDLRRREGRFAFGYTYKLLKDTRETGAVFERDGCDVSVEFLYPATAEELVARPLLARAITVPGGRRIAVWRLVRAERSPEAEVFIDKAERVIAARLEGLAKELGGSLR